MLNYEVLERGEVIAAFKNRDDAKLFIEACGHRGMKIRVKR